VASNSIARLDRAEQEQIVGTPRDWVDRAVDGPVGYFYDGETYWNTVYQQRFWNRRIDRVAATTPVPGPMPQTPFRIGPDGAIPLHEKWVVASDQHVLTGTPVAHVTERNSDVTGLTLWEVDGHPQLSLEKYGFLPNGDMVAPAVVNVWGCQGGKLQLTLLPKATKELIIELDGRVVVDRSIANEAAAHIFVPVPPSPRPHMCNFRIVPQSLLGSTVVQFLRP
jgi:hypothetical protein